MNALDLNWGVVNLKEDLEKERIHEDTFKTSSTMLDELIVGQKASKDKDGLGLERGESSKENQKSNTKISKSKKIEGKRKYGKFRNHRSNAQ